MSAIRSLNDTYALPFDMFQRYQDAAILLNCVTKDNRLRVLDVGGHPGVVPHFLRQHDCAVVDILPVNGVKSIVGSAVYLPLRSRAFDVAISLDVLEHIPEADRERAVREMFRVSREYVILGCPFGEEETLIADRFVYEFIRRISGEKHRFLEEHLRFGLPTLHAIRSIVGDASRDFIEVPNGYLFNWLPMMIASQYLERQVEVSDLAGTINRLYNKYVYPTDHKEPAYRRIFLASKNRRMNKRRVVATLQAVAANESHQRHLEKIHLTQILTWGLQLASSNDARDQEFSEKQRMIEELEAEGLKKQAAIEELQNFNAAKQGVIEQLQKSDATKQAAIDELREELRRLQSSRSFRYTAVLRRLFDE